MHLELTVLVLIFLSSVRKVILTDNPRQRLASHLFDNYQSYLRPYCGNHDDTTNVTLDISLRQLVDLDEPIQMLKVNVWIRMVWYDCHLMWNTSNFNDIDNIVVPYDKIWIPDLTLYDSVATEVRGFSEFRPLIYSNGTVDFKFPMLVESECVVNVRYFPYDTQFCKLKYGSWAHNGLEIDFWPKNAYGDLDQVVENTEWEITGFSAKRHVEIYSCCPEPYPDVTFILKIKRKPLFYIVNIIIPTFLITLMGILVFGLPVESGEKVSLEITVMLSLAVFQLLVADSMPPSAATVPLIAVYFDFSLSLIGFACVMSVISINFYCRQHTRMSPFMRKLLFCCCAKITLLHIPPEHQYSDVTSDNDKEASNNKTGPLLHRDIQLHVKDELQNHSTNSMQRHVDNNNKDLWSEEWKLASLVVDRFSCVIFIVLLVSVTLYIFVQFG